jgi:hypothetical protein
MPHEAGLVGTPGGAGFLLCTPRSRLRGDPLYRRVPSNAGSCLGSTGPSAPDDELEQVFATPTSRSMTRPHPSHPRCARCARPGTAWRSPFPRQSRSWSWERTDWRRGADRHARRSWSRAAATPFPRTGRKGFGPTPGCAASRPRSGPPPPLSHIDRPAASWPGGASWQRGSPRGWLHGMPPKGGDSGLDTRDLLRALPAPGRAPPRTGVGASSSMPPPQCPPQWPWSRDLDHLPMMIHRRDQVREAHLDADHPLWPRMMLCDLTLDLHGKRPEPALGGRDTGAERILGPFSPQACEPAHRWAHGWGWGTQPGKGDRGPRAARLPDAEAGRDPDIVPSSGAWGSRDGGPSVCPSWHRRGRARPPPGCGRSPERRTSSAPSTRPAGGHAASLRARASAGQPRTPTSSPPWSAPGIYPSPPSRRSGPHPHVSAIAALGQGGSSANREAWLTFMSHSRWLRRWPGMLDAQLPVAQSAWPSDCQDLRHLPNRVVIHLGRIYYHQTPSLRRKSGLDVFRPEPRRIGPSARPGLSVPPSPAGGRGNGAACRSARNRPPSRPGSQQSLLARPGRHPRYLPIQIGMLLG